MKQMLRLLPGVQPTHRRIVADPGDTPAPIRDCMLLQLVWEARGVRDHEPSVRLPPVESTTLNSPFRNTEDFAFFG